MCRPRDETKINNACQQLVTDVNNYFEDAITTTYDIFISYSHGNSAIANLCQKMLLDKCPNVKIFIDRVEIKTGIVK